MAPPVLPKPKAAGTQTKLYPLFAKHGKKSISDERKLENDPARPDISDSDDDDEEDNLPLSMLARQPTQKRKPFASNKPVKRPRPAQGTRLKDDDKTSAKKPQANSTSSESTASTLENTGRKATPLSHTKPPPTTHFDMSSTTTNVSEVSAVPTPHANNTLEKEEDHPSDDKVADPKENIAARVSLSPEKPCHPNRIFSDSAMDFDNPEQAQPLKRKTNVAVSLLQRSVYGNMLGTDRSGNMNRRKILHQQHTNPQHNGYESAKCPIWRWPSKWRESPWVSLALGPVKHIDHIVWDEAGILLAVATDRVISIYDWDMIRAADMQGRRDRARECHDSAWNIPPIIQFYTPTPVSKLLWNRFHQDELIAGFRVGGKVHVYNVDKVAQWLLKDSGNQRLLPPKKTYRMIDVARNDASVSDILFVDDENVLVSTSNSMVYRYKFIKRTSAIAMLIWRYQASSTVTSMAQIGKDVCVIGMVYGQLCLLDWTKYSKERSFSNDQRPKILQRLIPHDGLAAPREDILLGKRMGILKLRVDATNTQCEASKYGWGRCRITWVTKCGWLLSISLDSPTLQDKCKVHHASPRVVYRNAAGEMIDSARKSWSLPPSSVAAFLSPDTVCVMEVPAVTNILTHHDKFVLDGQPNTIRSKKRAMVVMTNEGKQSISLPKCVKQLPHELEVHPSHEWILLAEGKRLHLLSYKR